MQTRKPRLYTASKLSDCQYWLDFRTLYADKVDFTARWLDFFSANGSFDDAKMPLSIKRAGWVTDIDDVRFSDAVVVKAPSSGNLRGALVEAGVALGLGRPVYLLGDCPDYGTWQHHPLVYRMCRFENVVTDLLSLEI